MFRTARQQAREASLYGRVKSRNAADILREQEQESEMERLWMDGPAYVNEEEPRRRTLLGT
ncbi:hypothetical protein [Gorillibacterium sp. sgz5001074]|uniref:hypothetical protein n=1 Tax=Gorillibacterium sp. sgz5001074 TaxID=3446695 RepID=UPI003F66FA24